VARSKVTEVANVAMAESQRPNSGDGPTASLCFVEELCDSTCNMWVEVNLLIQLIQKINKSIKLDVVGNKGEVVLVMHNTLQLQQRNHKLEKFE